MKPTLKFKKKINKVLSEKESRLPRTIGKLGDGYGNLYADDTRTIVWVRFGETKAIPVFCNRVPPENELQVVVGYSPEQPKLYQVLSTYSDKPGGELGGILGGYAPAKRYEWLAPKGGQDPLYVHLRAFTPLGIYVSHPPSMSVQLMRGMVINASKTPIEVPAVSSDHTAYIPATAGKAVLVLHTIDNDGLNVETVSAEFDIDLLMPEGNRFANVPALPTDTVFVRGLVRVYYGQTKVQEGRTNRDIIDMRFPGFYGGAAGAVAWADIVGKPETWDELWAELTGASAGVAAIADPLYARKWLKSADPTVDDDTSTGYSKTDLWLNQATSSLFICLDASDGAAVWLPVGSSGGAPVLFHADGTLAVLTSAAVPYLVTQDLTIESWYIYCEDNGSASSTIVDVNKNGTTVFTTQGNRPTLSNSDADNWAISGLPEVTTFTEGDVISIDIDQIATGAKNMLIVGFISSASGGGGGGFNLTVGGVPNVGEISTEGLTVEDQGGGQVVIRPPDYIYLRDEKTAATDGGTFTSGAWRKRDINTEVSDVGNHASLSSSQITLAAGTYEFAISCPAFNVNNHRAKLYNVTDAADVELGTSMFTGTGSFSTNRSEIVGRFTIGSSKVFEIQHKCGSTQATNGFGEKANLSDAEIYTIARFWKVA